MGCHLTSTITRSRHELLSHVKNIGTPHTSHCPPPPKTNRASGENNSRADDGFSVFSGLMTRPLPNSSVFHPRQSLQGIMDDSAGKKRLDCISISHISLMQTATFNWIYFFIFFFMSDLLLGELIFSVILLRSESCELCDYFLLLSSGFWQALTPTSTVSLYQTSRKPKKRLQIMCEMINCYWQHSEISFARTPTPWTSHSQRLRLLGMWSLCLFDLK